MEEQQEAMMKASKPGWKPRASRLKLSLCLHAWAHSTPWLSAEHRPSQTLNIDKFRGPWTGSEVGILMADGYVAWDTLFGGSESPKIPPIVSAQLRARVRLHQLPWDSEPQCQLLTASACSLRLHRGVQASAEPAQPVQGHMQIQEEERWSSWMLQWEPSEDTDGRFEEVSSDQGFSGGMSIELHVSSPWIK